MMNAAPILIREVMTRGAETVEPINTIHYAAGRMRALGVGFLVVESSSDGIVGVITDRDITVRATANGLDPNHALVRDAMTPQVVSIFEDQEIAEAAHLMEKKGLRRLVVLDRAYELVGVLSVDDVAGTGGVTWMAGEVLRRASRLLP